MGLFRLYLAVCVLVTHSEPICGLQLHNGREAVQIFFIISGFYMQFVLESGKYESVSAFYKSRALRIYIPYYFVLVLVAAISITSGAFTGNYLTLSHSIMSTDYGDIGHNFALFSNFSIIFQDWIMFLEHPTGGMFGVTPQYWKSDHPLWHVLWIPQAWSVGVELTFYLIAPFLALKCSSKWLVTCIVCIFIARIATYGFLGYAQDPWTYRFFPFELSHFLLGILAARSLVRYPKLFNKLSSLGGSTQKALHLLVTVVILSLILIAHKTFFDAGLLWARDLIPGGAEIIHLLSLGIWPIIVPILFSLTKNIAVDRNVGDLSYPVYLIHYTVIAIVTTAAPFWKGQSMISEISILISLAVAIGLQLSIFSKVEEWRHRVTRAIPEREVAN